MKKSMGILALAITATGFASSASAAGGYIFADVGRSDFDVGSEPNISVDDTDTLYGVGLGYSFNDYFSIEAGFADLGETSASSRGPISANLYGSNVTIDGKIALDANGFFYGIRGDLPITESFNLFARLGMLHWQSDADVSGTVTIDGTSSSGSFSENIDDGTDPYVGIGADYGITDHVSLNAQWNRYMLEVADEDLDVDTLSVGITFRF